MSPDLSLKTGLIRNKKEQSKKSTALIVNIKKEFIISLLRLN